MSTYDAAQTDLQPVSESTPRWSPEDDLLVWTVSRIDGGRRHGVEPDCHVVYGMSRGYFVEQTRTFRASAEQCIEMLQQGKRAGSTQRKIALDTIVAIRSDARTGRLQIRTLNGTHQLDPVSYDEADVLRQIAIELELRMPPGGAEFLPLTDSRQSEDGRGGYAEERRALVSLENARAEDAPDNHQDPEYRYGAAHGPGDSTDVEAQSVGLDGEVDHPGHFTEQELDRLAESLMVETEVPEPEDSDGPDHALPTDITVAGGAEITYAPNLASDPPPETPSVSSSYSASAADDSSLGLAAAAMDAPSSVDAPDESDDSPIYISQQAGEPEHAESPASDRPDPADPGSGEVADGGFSHRYGRLSHRALRHHIETGSQLSQPDTETRDQAASSVFVAPTEPTYGPDPGGTEEAPISGTQPATTETFEDRRHADDPNFPSIFDRRGAVPAAPLNGPVRFGDDLPVDHTFSQHAEVRPESEQEPGESDDSESDMSASPPTITTSAGPPQEGVGGTVGFNPDFDVNPFR